MSRHTIHAPLRATHASVEDWRRAADDSRRRAEHRRQDMDKNRESRAWTEGFLLGVGLTMLFVVAWFLPVLP